MKKILLVLISLLFITGCNNSLNTPTKTVEDYLSKYQNLDGEVTSQLDRVISSDTSMSDDNKKDYKELMLNQYKNLSYKVVDENINDDEAEVEVEIEVLDYASSIGESRVYYRNHLDEFEADVDDDMDNLKSFIEYKIKNMKSVSNTRKDTVTFFLNKVDNEWVLEDLSDNDIKKLHGIYEG